MKTFVLLLFILLSVPIYSQDGFIIDHTNTDLTQIPDSWINLAKANLRIHYFRASHGSQIDDGGMTALQTYFGDKYKFRGFESTNSLFLTTQTECIDCDYTADWVADTRTYLDNTANADVNTVMWAFSFNFYAYDVQSYLDSMEVLIADYGPGGAKLLSGDRTTPITFILQTACSSSSTVKNEKIYVGNQLIRQHCVDNNRVLFDFNDIECYNPDGDYFGDANLDGSYSGLRLLDDDCSYVVDPAVPNTRGNWGIEWIAANPTSELAALTNSSVCVSCAHSMGSTSAEEDSRLHCVLKGKAAWWMWAKLVGWGAATLSTTPNQPLTETNLDNSSIALAVSGDSFVDATLDAANFQLNNAPTGTNIESLSYTDATHATLNLAFDGTNFDMDITNFNITILTAELNGSTNITGNDLTIEAFGSISISSSTSLSESSLDASVIDILLEEESFADATLEIANFQLNNAPAGTSIESVSYTDATHATLNLAFDGTNFDADVTDFSITVLAVELSSTVDQTSNNLTVTANTEGVNISSSTALSESNLDAAVIDILLEEETFTDAILEIANFQLNNAPTGTSIESVSYTDATHATLNLAFDGTNFDADVTDFSITVLAIELRGTINQSSNELTITAELESGVQRIHQETKITLFPNPNNGIFSFKLNLQKSGSINVNIVNLSGKRILQKEYSGSIGENLIEFDLSGEKPGIQIIFIKFENEEFVVPLIKK